ncbi:[NiFe] hydrogenase metallocenter assembly protein HypD [hydrothermal vent metagenome]|uniref:[NiFe] hydrogenase metallocenter assembly protein HypD n=1 Tax=hydrothermal vent metagenome TaxID=652676 RepID=A0A3B1BJP0_9ZZZZ
MNYIDKFRNGAIAKKLVADLEKSASRLNRQITLMEVCGSHTMAIYRHGIKELVPQNIKLVSGPGCPVCVTPVGYIDTAIEIAQRDNVIITTFGDMMRVPGTTSSLQTERGRGADVRVVYSPMDAIDIAKKNETSEVVFLGVGFETTAPTSAVAILTAEREDVKNFSVLTACKTMPEPMIALMDGELRIDGYICPAHVSAIIGEDGYKPIVNKKAVPCVITGFEPLDILRGLRMLTDQVAEGRAEVENEYFRVVKPCGNKKAQDLLSTVYVKADAVWRGLGKIPNSGLAISPAYEKFDAAKRFKVTVPEPIENPACLCGDILRGLKEPLDCPLFAKACDPENPIGACMVSSEGTCAAEYRYGDWRHNDA